MNFTVYWRPSAEGQILGYLLRAADKPALWAVVRDIDTRLRRSPGGEGESRGDDVRVAFVRPFSVIYRIDGRGQVVYVEAVGWAGY